MPKIKALISLTIIMNSHLFYTTFTLVSIAQLLEQHKIDYQKIDDAYSFHLNRFPLSLGNDIQPYQGSFPETFILTIPHGRIHSPNGWVTIDNCVIQELFWRHNSSYIKYVDEVSELKLQKISGRVIALAQLAHNNYYHFLYEILGRLSLIDAYNIQYDWIYVPYHLPFMKELLQLWGVDSAKIIPANDQNYYIEADELIVPAMIINTCFEPETSFGGYLRKNILQYLHEKLINATDKIHSPTSFNEKIFISRKGSKRYVTNEDEVFNIFQAKGFSRYILDTMSVTEQIKLFQQAKIIVAIHGAGCCNMMFSNPGTRFIELFQALPDSTFSNMASVLNIDYSAVQTSDFINDPYFSHIPTKMPLFIIEKIAHSL